VVVHPVILGKIVAMVLNAVVGQKSRPALLNGNHTARHRGPLSSRPTARCSWPGVVELYVGVAGPTRR
jgi:hypothetical protein